MIPIKFLNFNSESPEKGYWDMHLLEKIFQRHDFVEIGDLKKFQRDHPLFSKILNAIVVIPARHNYEYIEEINTYLSNFDGVILIIAGDEESKFEVEKIKHPNIKIWLMTPHAGKRYDNVDRFIGEGFTPHMDKLSKDYPNKDIIWSFAGQNTHKRRVVCIRELLELQEKNDLFSSLVVRDGFAQGDKDDYVRIMERSRIVPCPGGPVTPDTFRVYEALESGCIPIVDNYATYNMNDGYWNLLFGQEIPFPTIKNWVDLSGMITYYNDVFESKRNEIFAWWQMYKRNLYHWLIEDYIEIGGWTDKEEITFIIPTSPTESNPDTSMVEETISSIRVHRPEAEIIITFDGVREEQSDKKDNYEKFKSDILWKCNRKWKNIIPIVFKDHTHQVGMLKEALKHVKTDYIVYVEHDTPLTPDMTIEWNSLIRVLDSKKADLIRFHFEAFIPEPHKYLMIGEVQEIENVKLLKTVQWSQRPHIASVEFYKRILNDHFSENAKTFIEDKMHGVVISAWKQEQLQGWNKFKLWIYHPEGGNIKRSYHLDGRGKEQKYDMIF